MVVTCAFVKLNWSVFLLLLVFSFIHFAWIFSLLKKEDALRWCLTFFSSCIWRGWLYSLTFFSQSTLRKKIMCTLKANSLTAHRQYFFRAIILLGYGKSQEKKTWEKKYFILLVVWCPQVRVKFRCIFLLCDFVWFAFDIFSIQNWILSARYSFHATNNELTFKNVYFPFFSTAPFSFTSVPQRDVLEFFV